MEIDNSNTVGQGGENGMIDPGPPDIVLQDAGTKDDSMQEDSIQSFSGKTLDIEGEGLEAMLP